MPRNNEIFTVEIKTAIEAIQKQGKTIILRKLIEAEVCNHPEKYPNLGKLHDIPLKMAISAVLNRMPGIEVYRKRPASWTVSDCMPEAAYV